MVNQKTAQGAPAKSDKPTKPAKIGDSGQSGKEKADRSSTKSKSLSGRLLKWLDGWRLAAMGIVLASRKLKFWLVLALSFAIFGTLLSLLSGGMGAVNLFFATDMAGKGKILADGFLVLFGVGRNFADWLLIFVISLLQALLIALIVLVWRKRRRDGAMQSAGIVAGLAILGSGCPTCGTALITPVLGAIFSTGSYAMAGTISGIITWLAIIIALLSLKKVGEQAYVIMVDEEWRQGHSTASEKGTDSTKKRASKGAIRAKVTKQVSK